jgi:hypothetical protein
MKRLLLLVAVLGCGKSADEQLREQVERDMKRNAPLATETPNEPSRELPAPKPETPPPAPEPTTPEEIDTARKQAMIDGRDKDVIKYCELGKVDPDKSDPQVVLGCVLAACRIDDVDRARAWAQGLTRNKKDRPLYDQAKKTCLANRVGL